MFLLFAHLMVGTDYLLAPNTANLFSVQHEIDNRKRFISLSSFCPVQLLSMSFVAPWSTCSENGSMGDSFELAFS